jgi:hypothetical protein
VEHGPKIKLDKTVHDFGQIGMTTRHNVEFTFTNAGDAPLRVLEIKPCCGTVPSGVRPGQEYAPGESGTLKLRYAAGYYPGPVAQKVHLTTNDPEQKTVTLTLKATIMPRVACEPKRLQLFLNRSNAGCPALTVSSLDYRPFSITGFASTQNAITAAFDANVEAVSFTLEPKADLAKLRHALRGQISIDLTHPECQKVNLLFDVVPEFTITPSTVTLLGLKAGQSVRREILILSHYHDDFDIESISSEKNIVKLVSSTKLKEPAAGSSNEASTAKSRYRIIVEVMPPPGKTLSDTLDVKIAGGSTLTIPCRGFYKRN